MKNERMFQRTALVLAIIVYVGARLWDLTASCLWFDEIFSIHAAEHSWKSILWFVSLDLIHPPLFYLVLKIWMSIGGEALFWLRLLPVGLSVLAVFPFIAFCRELKLNYWTQALALFLFAVNGSMIKYSQEVRMYSLLMCLSLFSMWLFARYFVKGKSFVPLVIVNILLVYSHYFGWFIVLTEVIAIFSFQRIKWRPIMTMLAITFASFLPWLAAVWQASSSGSGLSQNIGWMSQPGLIAVSTFILNLIEPFHFQASSAEPVTILKISLPLLLLVIGTFLLYVLKLRNHKPDDREKILLLLLFMKIPVTTVFIASWLLPYSIWGTRHLIIVFAPFCILLAVVFTPLTPRWLPTFAMTLTLLFAGYSLYVKATRESSEYSWCAWESLTTMPPDSALSPVYAVEDLVAYHVWFAGRRYPTSRVVKVNGIDGVREDTAYFLPRGFDGVEIIDLAEVSEPRIWLAFRGSVFETEPPMRNFLVKGYRIAGRTDTTTGGEDLMVIELEKEN